MISIAVALLGVIFGLSVLSISDPDIPTETQSADVNSAISDDIQGPTYRYVNFSELEVQYDDYGDPLPATSGQNFTAQSGQMKQETLTIDLPLDGSVEYKMIMDQGGGAVYTWTVEGGEAYYDFHAHQKSENPDLFTRYAEGESTSQSGSIVAAYAGQHGWFWFNIADGPITITLNISGFYEELIKVSPKEN
jgi:hypothetical protein